MVSQSILANQLGIKPALATAAREVATNNDLPIFQTPEEQKIAQITHEVIRKLENQPQRLPCVSYLNQPDLQAEMIREVKELYRPAQIEFEGFAQQPDVAAIVAKTTELVIKQTIDIPSILIVPMGEVRSGFKPFELELGTLSYQAPSEELWIQYLRTGGTEVVGIGEGGIEEARLEDYIVRGLVDFDDVDYDKHADLLYTLAGQTVRHFRTYLSEEDTHKVLRLHQREIARFIHAQMQLHYWEEAAGYEVKISKSFTDLKPSAYAASTNEPPMDFHQSPADKANMAKYLFNGFKRCLYPVQKFHSEAERILAVILDREAIRWFKPAKGQFHIFYKSGADNLEYQPDFVAETAKSIYMLEPKARNQMEDADVLAKRDVAIQWCDNASAYAATCGGTSWNYILIPHDLIAANMTIEGLIEASRVKR